MNNPSDPAFPADASLHKTYIGLTKREHFAAQALPACIASTILVAQNDYAVKAAVEYADMLIAELNKEK